MFYLFWSCKAYYWTENRAEVHFSLLTVGCADMLSYKQLNSFWSFILFRVGYRWVVKFLALGCYAVLLFPGFVQGLELAPIYSMYQYPVILWDAKSNFNIFILMLLPLLVIRFCLWCIRISVCLLQLDTIIFSHIRFAEV